MKKLFVVFLTSIILFASMTSCVLDTENFLENEGIDAALIESDKFEASETVTDDENAKEMNPKDEKLPPYELVYTSNGDGTCVLSAVYVRAELESRELIVPELSPDGDKVVGINIASGNDLFPAIIAKETFEHKIATEEAKEILSDIDFVLLTRSFFKEYSLECDAAKNNESMRNAWLEQYPVLEKTDIVIFAGQDYKAVSYVSGLLDKIGFDTEDRKAASTEISELCEGIENWELLERAKYPSSVDSFSKIILPEGIKSVSMFGASGIESISLPDSVSAIEIYAFAGCEKLSFVEIPATVSQMGEDVFKGCENLANITFGGTREEWTKLFDDDQYLPIGCIVKCTDGDIAKADDN